MGGRLSASAALPVPAAYIPLTALEKNSRLSKGNTMPFWQRLLITFVAMLLVSVVVGYAWTAALGLALPSYVSGIIGGFTALPVWEFLKRVGPSD